MKIKKARISVNFLFVGFILLSLSQFVQPLYGNMVKYGFMFLGVSAIFSSAIIRISRLKITARTLDHYLLFGLVFFGIILLSILNNHTVVQSSVKLGLHIVTFIIFICGFTIGLEKKYNNTDDSFTTNRFFILVSFVTLFINYSFIKNISLISIANQIGHRGLGIEELNSNGVAYNALIILFIYFVFFRVSNSKILKSLYLLVLLSACGIIIISVSRGIMLWGTIGIICLLFVQRNRRKKHRVFNILLLLIFIFLIQNKLNDELLLQRIEHTTKRFTLLIEQIGEGSDAGPRKFSTVDDRIQQYRYELESWDRWILWGKYEYNKYPHNQFLEILVRFGVLGLPLLFFSISTFVYSIFTLFRKNIKKYWDIETYYITGIFISSYLISMSSLSLEMNKGLWLGFGFFFALSLRRKNYIAP